MKRDEAKRREIADLVREWRASGESVRAFAERRGVGAHVLHYWKGRVDARPAGAVLAAPRSNGLTFAPVQVLPEAAGEIEVSFGNGTRVRVGGSANAALVRTVLRALAGRC
jgi:hypothetical protein